MMFPSILRFILAVSIMGSVAQYPQLRETWHLIVPVSAGGRSLKQLRTLTTRRTKKVRRFYPKHYKGFFLVLHLLMYRS